MPKFQGSTERLKFDSNIISEKINSILREAVRVYVQEAYRHIRVDTGMSRGTLVPLARAVGGTIPISPKRTLPGKNISAGANQSIVKFTNVGNVHTFEWSTDVFQYYLNERFPLRSNRNTPWNSLEKGNQKVRDFLLSVGPDLMKTFRQSWTKSVRRL